MGKITGFKEFDRKDPSYRSVEERIQNMDDFICQVSDKDLNDQASRCMDCGVPFCHSEYGCPLGNVIPEFNDQVYQGRWEEAFETLFSTNNFPEFTGRICPAPCESACVLGIVKPPVTIKNIEVTISDKSYEKGYMKPRKPSFSTGKKVAIIGSGPAGLAAADQLNKAGHKVTVFERENRIGGLLMYGIPNFKLDKAIVDRRVDLMTEEGVSFETGVHVGVNKKTDEILNDFDAVILAIGSTKPRDLPIEGREAKGIYFAMSFLTQNTKRVLGETIPEDEAILATGKHVIVIGGGDTGSDCVGTSIRQKAASVTQIELLSKPPVDRDETMPWPLYPRVFRISSSQAEGCERDFAVLTKRFVKNEAGEIKALECVRIEWDKGDGTAPPKFNEIEGSEFSLKADLLLLAMGFVHPEHKGLLTDLNFEKDQRGNVRSDERYATNQEKVFVAGDVRRGQSLVVWAISEGRECAHHVDEYLMKRSSRLLQKKGSFLSEEAS
ncbi:glutamate synthase [PVC group bacterium (ex Bugula neritina AB1)]|nr:glutamate synthase [PVC group bacterium (ex Bugula neritina AB1)]